MQAIKRYGRALCKRSRLGAHAPVLPATVLSQRLYPDSKHYQRYCDVVEYESSMPLHPCYLQVRALPQQMDLLLLTDSPFALLGLVHMGNHVWQSAQIRRDIPWDVSVSFSKVTPHHRGWLVTVSVNASQRGVPVYQAMSEYLARTSHQLEVERTAAFALPASATQLAALTAKASIGRVYAGVSGDYNPIHLSALSAKLFGFPCAIAHGMWSLASSYALIAKAHMPHGNRDVTLTNHFVRPMLLPAEAKLLVAHDGGGFAFCLSDVAMEAGKEHMSGKVLWAN